MSSVHNTSRDTNGTRSTVDPDSVFADGALVVQMPFRVGNDEAVLIDQLRRERGESRAAWVRRVVRNHLAEELEVRARKLRAAG
jgi:hypothetical protein